MSSSVPPVVIVPAGPEMPGHGRVDGFPRPGPRGLTVFVRLRPAAPVTPGGTPQIALAHAHDGAGWWIGVGADGRAIVGVSTTAGPVSVPVGVPLLAGCDVGIRAEIPGAAGGRLRIEVTSPDGGTATSGAVLGRPLVPSPGPLTWGCRTLRDGRIPEHPFAGEVGDVLVVSDAAAVGSRAELAAHPAVLAAWDEPVLTGIAAP